MRFEYMVKRLSQVDFTDMGEKGWGLVAIFEEGAVSKAVFSRVVDKPVKSEKKPWYKFWA